jgi:hypothetical protein
VTAAARSRLFWQKGGSTGRQTLWRIGFRGAGRDCDAGPGMRAIAGLPPAGNNFPKPFHCRAIASGGQSRCSASSSSPTSQALANMANTSSCKAPPIANTQV